METYVTDNTALYELWKQLMGPGGFARRSIWMVCFYPDGRAIPEIQAFDEIPLLPDPAAAEGLETIVTGVLEAGVGSVAFLLSRPGSPAMSEGDRRWARALQRPCALGGWPLHLATYDTVRVFSADDLVESRHVG